MNGSLRRQRVSERQLDIRATQILLLHIPFDEVARRLGGITAGRAARNEADAGNLGIFKRGKTDEPGVILQVNMGNLGGSRFRGDLLLVRPVLEVFRGGTGIVRNALSARISPEGEVMESMRETL